MMIAIWLSFWSKKKKKNKTKSQIFQIFWLFFFFQLQRRYERIFRIDGFRCIGKKFPQAGMFLFFLFSIDFYEHAWFFFFYVLFHLLFELKLIDIIFSKWCLNVFFHWWSRNFGIFFFFLKKITKGENSFSLLIN